MPKCELLRTETKPRARGLGLSDGDFHGPLAHYHADAVCAVHQGRGRQLMHHDHLRVGLDGPGPEPAHVACQARHPVGLDSVDVGLHQHVCGVPGVGLAQTQGREGREHKPFQSSCVHKDAVVCRFRRHFTPPLPPACRRQLSGYRGRLPAAPESTHAPRNGSGRSYEEQ